jgi:hypothetical protein
LERKLKNLKKSNHQAAGSRCKWLLSILAIVASMTGCGGGMGGNEGGSTSGGTTGSTSQAGVTSGGTGAAFSGPISGFGSVYVNSIRFEDNVAKITLDDDNTSARDSDLRLGMMAEIEGEKDASGLSGKASTINSHSHVQGSISAIDVAGNRLTVLGVVVTTISETVFDGTGVTGLASLAMGDSVEIHGMADNLGGLRATRIEKTPNTNEVRLIGTVQNATSASFEINGITVQYQPDNLVNLSGGVSNGMLVRVKGTLSNAATIVAGKVRQVALTPAVKEAQEVEIEGIVTSFTSTANFEVNGLRVTVPNGARVEGTVVLGSRVEVEGVVADNTLVANKVKLKHDDQQEIDANELHDPIFAIDQASQTFTVRNGTVAVQWNSNTRFDSPLLGGASLEVGMQVEVKGNIVGSVLLADRIKIDH